MFDELDLLRDSPTLQRLLGHYAEGGAANPEAWQDRLAELEGVQPRELVGLHGLLIAFGWIAQNTGNTPSGQPGILAGCYKVTADGMRALRRTRYAGTEDGEADAAMDRAIAEPSSDASDAPGREMRSRRRRPAYRPALPR